MFQSISKYYKQNDQIIFVMLGQLAVFAAIITLLVLSVMQVSTWNGFRFDPFLTIALVFIMYQQNKVLKSIQDQNQQNIQILSKLIDKQTITKVNSKSTKLVVKK